MNITIPTEERKPLPQLIKQPATYKLFIPRKVEEKIRYLIRKYPHTEWSGILFISHTGSFETGDLEIHCEDIYPMDLGTGGWTEFKMTPDVTTYIAENMELFDCDMSLVHSHHSLGAFLSGQDLKTLQIEGNDTNCFVSLIVDTPGNYVAAITRKVKSKKSITTEYLGSSYEFFGEGEKQLTKGDVGMEEVETTAIEYFMLDVQREVVDNPLDFLDKRFEEIEAQKKSLVTTTTNTSPWIPKSSNQSSLNKEWNNNYFFSDWLNNKKKEDSKQPTLFTDDEMGIDYSKWEPDPTIIHHLVCQMIACSLILNTDKFDLKQWITFHMEKKYKEIFGTADYDLFDEWKEFIVEFMLNKYEEQDVPELVYEDFDLYQSKLASAIYNELYQYPANVYLDAYREVLSRYMHDL